MKLEVALKKWKLGPHNKFAIPFLTAKKYKKYLSPRRISKLCLQSWGFRLCVSAVHNQVQNLYFL